MGAASEGFVNTGSLYLNSGKYHYRLRIDNGFFVIDHYDPATDSFHPDLIVSPSTDLEGQDFQSNVQSRLTITSPIVTSNGNITTSDLTPLVLSSDIGKVVIQGNLQVTGTTTSVNAENLDLRDKVIRLAREANDDLAADGAGVQVCGSDYTGNNDAVSLLWRKNSVHHPFWDFGGGDLQFGRTVNGGSLGSRKVSYRWMIDEVTENLQLWKTVNQQQPTMVSEFMA